MGQRLNNGHATDLDRLLYLVALARAGGLDARITIERTKNGYFQAAAYFPRDTMAEVRDER